MNACLLSLLSSLFSPQGNDDVELGADLLHAYGTCHKHCKVGSRLQFSFMTRDEKKVPMFWAARVCGGVHVCEKELEPATVGGAAR